MYLTSGSYPISMLPSEIYTAVRNYSYMISNDAGHSQVFITGNDCPGIDRENHR